MLKFRFSSIVRVLTKNFWSVANSQIIAPVNKDFLDFSLHLTKKFDPARGHQQKTFNNQQKFFHKKLFKTCFEE